MRGEGEEEKRREGVCFLVFGYAFVGGVGLGSNESMQNIQRSCPLCFLHSAGWTSVAVQGGGVAVDPASSVWTNSVGSHTCVVFVSLSDSITMQTISVYFEKYNLDKNVFNF